MVGYLELDYLQLYVLFYLYFTFFIFVPSLFHWRYPSFPVDYVSSLTW